MRRGRERRLGIARAGGGVGTALAGRGGARDRDARFAPNDHPAGFGAEDWLWSCESLLAGVRHLVVPETAAALAARPPDGRGVVDWMIAEHSWDARAALYEALLRAAVSAAPR